MSGEEFPPGQWLDINHPALRRRLLALARRHLRGYEHLAEDVLQRSVLKWLTIPLDRAGVARIERVVTTEALSIIRSEQRLHRRNQRVFDDPTLSTSGRRPSTPADDLVILRHRLVELCRIHRHQLTPFDFEVFELLTAGYSVAEISRRSGIPRHIVKRSVNKWRLLLRSSGLGPPPPTREPEPGEGEPCGCPTET